MGTVNLPDAEWLALHGVKQDGEFTIDDLYFLLAKAIEVDLKLEDINQMLEPLGGYAEFGQSAFDKDTNQWVHTAEIVGDWQQFKQIYESIYTMEMQYWRKRKIRL